MKIIKKLSEMIEDEISGAKCYAKKALEWKSEHKDLADVLFELSTEEMHHLQLLHIQVEKIISKYREEKGEPPAEMLAVYDYLHKKHIEQAEEVKRYQSLYKDL